VSVFELFLIGLSLSLDVAVVSVGAGALNRICVSRALFIAGIFGFFQAVMPLVGWLFGSLFFDWLMQYGNYIGFTLILLVGFKMLAEAFGKEDTEKERDILETKTLLLLAIATSIDALVIGVTFTFMKVQLFFAVIFIGFITFIVSLWSIYFGTKMKHFVGSKIELIGGLILIVLAFKVLLT
jgi:putative Mn2+ efflux pump MntP